MPLLPIWLAVAGTIASAATPQSPPLGLLGLAPGLVQSDLQERVAKLGGKMSCRTSTVDRRFAECTAMLSGAPDGRRWELLASLIDGTSAVILLKTGVSEREVEQLKSSLTTELGRPNYRKQGEQQSFEWIRAGRMMRLTSRPERGRVQLSVSLVEGSVLDALDASR
jgi:hypothetical protein